MAKYYDVFVSYAGVDQPQAMALQAGLQRFARPWYRLQALSVFLDGTSLSPDTIGLWSSIEERLRRTRWLVLLASPEAAASKWVQLEVQWWRDNRSETAHIRRFVMVLTDGELKWGDEDLDWQVTDAAPSAALAGAFPAEPLWAKLPRRDPGSVAYEQLLPKALGALVRGRRVASQDPGGVADLRRCVENVAAAVRGIDKDLLAGDHRREFRRTRWTAAIAIGLVLALGVSLIVSWRQSIVGRDEAAAADLVRRAEIARTADPALALRLGIAADALAPSSSTRGGLTQTVAGTRYRGVLQGGAPVFAPTGTPRALTVDVHAVRLWDVTDPGRARQIAELPLEGFPVAAAFSPDAATIAVADSSGAVRIWDAAGHPHGVIPTQRSQDPGTIVPAAAALAFTPNGASLVVSTGDASVSVWDVRDQDAPRKIASFDAGADVTDLAISTDGRLLAVGNAAGATALWDLSEAGHPRPTPWSMTGSGAVTDVAFSSGGLLGVAGPDNRARLWIVGTGTAPRQVASVTNQAGMAWIAFSPSRPLLATGSRDGVADVLGHFRPRSPPSLGAEDHDRGSDRGDLCKRAPRDR